MTVILPSALPSLAVAVAGGAFPSPDVILTWRATNAREEKSYDLTSPADEREEGDDDGDCARSLPCRIVQLYRQELCGKGRGGERGFAEHLSLTLSTIDRGGESTLIKSLPYSHMTELRQPAKPIGAMDASVLHVSLPGWTMPSAVVSNSPLNFAHSSSKRTIAATTSVTHRRWNEKVCYVARSRHPRNLR